MAGGGRGGQKRPLSPGFLGPGFFLSSSTRSQASTASVSTGRSRSDSLDTDTGESDGARTQNGPSDALGPPRLPGDPRRENLKGRRSVGSTGAAGTSTGMTAPQSNPFLRSGGYSGVGGEALRDSTTSCSTSNHSCNMRRRDPNGTGNAYQASQLFPGQSGPSTASASTSTSTCPDVEGTSTSSSELSMRERIRPPGLRRRLHSSNSQKSASSASSSDSSKETRPFGMPRKPSADELQAIRATAAPIAFFTDANDECDHQARISVTPLTKIPYVHGGYSAVAPIMIHDTRWMAILRKLMPECHAGVALLLKNARKAGSNSEIDPVRIMKWAENNPVVAAYGMLNSDSGRRSEAPGGQSTAAQSDAPRRRPKGPSSPRKPALEWDVFLDPILVRHVDRAMQAVENMADDADFEARIAADVDVDRQVARLMNRMMLAHGSTTQLLAEAVGMAPKFNFSRVVEQGESRRRSSVWHSTTRMLSESILASRSTVSHASMPPTQNDPISEATAMHGSKSVAASGIFVERWLALFAKALQLGKEVVTHQSRCDTDSMHYSSALSGDDAMLAMRKDARSVMALGSDCDDDDDEAEDSFVLGIDDVIPAPPMCGLFLCLGMDDPNSHKADHGKSSMAKSAKNIQKLLGCPLRLVLDLKSRRVPPRVWGRLVDNLRSRGIGVDGLGSFDMDELRSIGTFCSTPVAKAIFLHSAGDLQRACHAQEIKHGDTVFFNAGSLIWKKPTLCEATGFGCCAGPTSALTNIDMNDASSGAAPGAWNNSGLVLGGYVFQPYAYPREKLELLSGVVQDCKATLEDYQKHFNLNIGLYVQEFAIGDGALSALASFVNHYPSIYNLGLAWGGINGATVKGVHGDGFWNQRYIGRDWDLNAEPTEHMKLLAPEDHHLFQKAIHTSDWGQALTVNQIAINPDEEEGLLHVPLCETPRYR